MASQVKGNNERALNDVSYACSEATYKIGAGGIEVSGQQDGMVTALVCDG